MPTPRALILRAPGANCDVETQFAFEQAGAVAERLHINRLREQPRLLQRYQILCIPGGFTYGDDVAAGKILSIHGRFDDRWVYLQATPGRCPFLTDYQRLYVPVAHGEGNFVCRAPWILKGLEQAGQLVLRYVDADGRPGPFPVNPNGSQADVAGLCDTTGRVLGLMPHPERHVLPTQHPQWTRRGLTTEGDGLRLFRNAALYFA